MFVMLVSRWRVVSTSEIFFKTNPECGIVERNTLHCGNVLSAFNGSLFKDQVHRFFVCLPPLSLR